MGRPRWSITQPASANDMTQLPRNGRWESQLIGDRRGSIVNETNRGVRYGYTLFVRESLPGVVFEFPRELADAYRAISLATFGRVKPFWFLMDGDDFGGLLYVRLDEDQFEPDFVSVAQYNGTLQQWLRWIMRASTEVEDQPLED